MINSFNYSFCPSIIFGPGSICRLAECTEQFGNNVLLLTGKGSLKKSGRLDKILKLFTSQNVIVNIEQVILEPSPEVIDNITKKYKPENIGCVVAVGGGSVMDAGKAVSAMLMMEGSVNEYLEGVGVKTPDGKKVPFIAVPTTSGTGSEATKNAVISDIGENGYKKSLRHNNYIPNISIIDPELTLDCPPDISAITGMDTFTQLLEAFLSDKCDVITESLALNAFKCIKSSLIQVVENGNDIEARTNMSYASFISGLALANAGLGTVHGFASPLGGYFNVPHGVVCGRLMAPANKYTIKKLLETEDVVNLKRYTMAASIFIEGKGNVKLMLEDFIDYLYNLTYKLNIPDLSKFGIGINDIDKIVDATNCKNNPVKHSKEELKIILTECL